MRFILDFCIVILLFVAAIWADFFRWGLGFTFPQETVLAVAILAAIGRNVVFSPQHLFDVGTRLIPISLVLLCALLVAIALFRGAALKDCVLAYAPCVAYMIAGIERRVLVKVAIATLFVSVALQAYEVVQHKFIYSPIIEGTLLDEREFGGMEGVFRSKGLFAGPTLATAFAIICALLVPRSRMVLLCAVAVATMSGSRSAILFAAIIGTITFVVSGWREKIVVGVLGSLTIFTMIGAAELGVLDQLAVDRIAAMFNSNASGNVSRWYYWQAAISSFLYDYSAIQHLVGWPRGSTVLFGNTTESQYLQILMDFGIVGLIIYGATAVWVLTGSNLDKTIKIVFAAFCVIAAVVPLYNQAGLCILYWLFMFNAVLAKAPMGEPQAGHETGYEPELCTVRA